MKKTLFVLILVLTLVLSACTSATAVASKESLTTDAPKVTTTEAVTAPVVTEPEVTTKAEVTTAATVKPAADGVIGDYVVKYVKHKIVKDYEDKPALAVFCLYTNNSDKAANYMFSIQTKCFQKGIELDSAIVIDDIPEINNAMRDVKPGYTLAVCSLYSLADTKSDVEFNISKLLSFDDETVITKILTLN
jgi:hypothetical protein